MMLAVTIVPLSLKSSAKDLQTKASYAVYAMLAIGAVEMCCAFIHGTFQLLGPNPIKYDSGRRYDFSLISHPENVWWWGPKSRNIHIYYTYIHILYTYFLETLVTLRKDRTTKSSFYLPIFHWGILSFWVVSQAPRIWWAVTSSMVSLIWP